MDKLHYLFDFFAYLVRRQKEDELKQNAAALTYLTLFAVVPIMTVAFTIFSKIPAFEAVTGNLQETLFSHFVPSTGAQVQEYLGTFATQAQNLSGIGILFIAITAVLMLRNIEQAFNRIWRTPGNRRGLTGILVYWAVLSLGPILLGLGLMISTYLTSLSIFTDSSRSLGLGPQLLKFMPLITSAATFMLLFFTIPNTRVPLKHAMAGGLITAVAFELAKKMFAIAVAGSSYHAVYGAFAAVPLFLLWVYVSWLILLAGAEFTRGLSGFEANESRLPSLLIAVSLLQLLQSHHKKGTTVPRNLLDTRDWAPGNRRIGSDRREAVINKLVAKGIIRVTDRGDLMLGKDLGQVTLMELKQLLKDEKNTVSYTQMLDEPWINTISEKLEHAKALGNQPLDIALDSLIPDKSQHRTTEN